MFPLLCVVSFTVVIVNSLITIDDHGVHNAPALAPMADFTRTLRLACILCLTVGH